MITLQTADWTWNSIEKVCNHRIIKMRWKTMFLELLQCSAVRSLSNFELFSCNTNKKHILVRIVNCFRDFNGVLVQISWEIPSWDEYHDFFFYFFFFWFFDKRDYIQLCVCLTNFVISIQFLYVLKSIQIRWSMTTGHWEALNKFWDKYIYRIKFEWKTHFSLH